jgi:hypothetical protein
MAGQSEPYRKMAADGAGTENANPHGVDVLRRNGLCGSFHKAAPLRNPSCRLHRRHGEKR